MKLKMIGIQTKICFYFEIHVDFIGKRFTFLHLEKYLLEKKMYGFGFYESILIFRNIFFTGKRQRTSR